MQINPPPVLTVSGLWDSGPQHWQTHWERSHTNVTRIQQRNWQRPIKDEWVQSLELAVRACEVPPLLAAHSLGCAVVAHWAQLPGRSIIKAALLVAPSDVDAPSYPKEAVGFSPMPLQPLPFPSFVVASELDEYVSKERATLFANSWGSRLRFIGAAGHINGAAGYGPWPEGLALLLSMNTAEAA